MTNIRLNSQGNTHNVDSNLPQLYPGQSREGNYQPHPPNTADPRAPPCSATIPWVSPGQAANRPIYTPPPSSVAPFRADGYSQPVTSPTSFPDPFQRSMRQPKYHREGAAHRAPVIKQEELTPPQRIAWFQDSLSESGSIGSDSTIQMPPHNHSAPNQENRQRSLSPLYSETTSESFPTDADSMWARQHELFQALECICTHAAKYYSRNEHLHRWSLTPNPRNPSHPHYRHHPYRHHPYPQPQPSQASHHRNPYHNHPHPPASQTTLLDYISRISTTLWSNALISPTNSHFAKLQAVNRMGNLYTWADKVHSATSGRRVFGEEEVFRLMLDARDLVGWCLFEEGKRDIERLWSDWISILEEGEIL